MKKQLWPVVIVLLSVLFMGALCSPVEDDDDDNQPVDDDADDDLSDDDGLDDDTLDDDNVDDDAIDDDSADDDADDDVDDDSADDDAVDDDAVDDDTTDDDTADDDLDITYEVIDAAGDVKGSVSLDIDANDDLHVAYQRLIGAGTFYSYFSLFYATNRADGWASQLISLGYYHELTPPRSESRDVGEFVAVRADASGTPHVVYYALEIYASQYGCDYDGGLACWNCPIEVWDSCSGNCGASYCFGAGDGRALSLALNASGADYGAYYYQNTLAEHVN